MPSCHDNEVDDNKFSHLFNYPFFKQVRIMIYFGYIDYYYCSEQEHKWGQSNVFEQKITKSLTKI